MLDLKQNRKTYSELLRPISGYEVEKIITTTYSLDMDTLIGICISLGLNVEEQDDIIANQIYMLRALEKMSKKIIVICQSGKIKVPKIDTKLYIILENMIYTINQEKGVFHPKVWFIKYINKENKDIKYKMIVSSKNLTFDRSWDTQIITQGEVHKNEVDENNSIISFVEFIRKNIKKQKDNSKQFDNIMDEFINELKYIKFDKDFNSEIKKCEFIHFGNTGNKIEFFENRNAEKIEEAFIISPFIKKEILNNLKEKLKKDNKITLITRREEIYEGLLDDDKINTYVINESILDGEFNFEEDEYNQCHQDIHSKIFIIKTKKDIHFYIGSANATNSAFNGNTEVIMHLIFDLKNDILEIIKKDLLECYEIMQDEKDIDKYNKIMYFVKATEIIKNNKEENNELKRLQKDILKINPLAIVKKQDENYNVEIQFFNYDLIDLYGYNLKIKPLLNTNISNEICEKVIFQNIKIEEISEFYIIDFSKNEEIVDSIVIKVPTQNLPSLEERISFITGNIIKDKNDFLQYLSFILNDDYLYTLLEEYKNKMKNNKYGKEYTPALYEKMLKAVSNDKTKIKEIEELMKYIKNKEKCIPTGFEELYEEFKKVVNEI